MQFPVNGQMFDTENPICPACGGAMWDNRTSKKFPSQPDFRCKNQECLDDKGRQTGVYLPKGNGPAKPAPKPAPKPAAQAPAAPIKPAPVAAPAPAARPTSGGRGDYGNSVPPSMYGAWAMNLVVSLVGQGKVSTVAEGIAAYKEALRGVGEAIETNKVVLDAKLPAQERQVPVAPAKPAQAPAKPAPAAKPAPKPATPAPAAAPAPVEAQPANPEDIQFDPTAEAPAAEVTVADPLDAVTGGVEEISMEDLSNVDI